MQPEISEIESLFFSREFQKLVEYSEKFNIFKMMQIHTKELVHSNIIAYLLNPEGKHGVGNLFLEKFMLRIYTLKRISGTSIELSEVVSLLNSKVKVHRELDNMDIVVDFPDNKIVLVIENKIWHHERKDQIKDYQDKLPTIYKNYHKYIVIFLTPDGKEPVSADSDHKQTSVYISSYNHILGIIEEIKENTTGDVRSFFNQFSVHLKEDIVGDIEVIKLCLEIYRKYPKAYWNMIKNLPSLNDLKSSYYKKIEDKYPEIKHWEYPAKQDRLIQIGVFNPKWNVQESVIMLYLDEDSYAIKICAALPKRHIPKYSDELNKLFGMEPVEIISGWSWWRFTKHGVSEIENNDVFGEITAQKTFKKFQEIYSDINDKLININA